VGVHREGQRGSFNNNPLKVRRRPERLPKPVRMCEKVKKRVPPLIWDPEPRGGGRVFKKKKLVRSANAAFICSKNVGDRGVALP